MDEVSDIDSIEKERERETEKTLFILTRKSF